MEVLWVLVALLIAFKLGKACERRQELKRKAEAQALRQPLRTRTRRLLLAEVEASKFKLAGVTPFPPRR